MQKNVFERSPKSFLLGIILVVCFISIVLMEKLAAHFGLGKTIVYQSHPIYGYRPIPNQIVARKPHQIVKINNLGLRAQEDWDLYNPSKKILFLGDSVTYGGSYISNEQLFSQLVGAQFPSFTTGNAAVNAWGVDNVCALIKDMEFLPAEIYVSVFPEGDFYRGLMRIGGQPFWTKKPRFALEELFHYLVYRIHIIKIPGTSYCAAENEKIATMSVRHLKELDDFLSAHHKIHLIYITPSRTQLLQHAPQDETLKSLFKQYGVQVYYLQDQLNTLTLDEKKDLFHDEIHLTVQGHRVWATQFTHDLKTITNNKNENI